MSVLRTLLVVLVGAWMIGTLIPQIECLYNACPDNGLYVTDDGLVAGVDDDSPAAKLGIEPGDRVRPPFPRDLFRQPPKPVTFTLVRGKQTRRVTVGTQPTTVSADERMRQLALAGSYLVFLVVGSAVFLLRPGAMTLAFYLYCVVRRYGDLGFYWPGSDTFFWTNTFVLAVLGGTGCVLVTMFALRFPNGRLDGWRRPCNAVALVLAPVLACAWLTVYWRVMVLGVPAQGIVGPLIVITSIVYLIAAGIFTVTLIRSHGDDRQRLRWIVVFPVILVMRVIAINAPLWLLPPWFPGLLTALGVLVPLSVAYAVVRRRVFDVQFAISRALIYAALSTIVAGTFLLLDWFIGSQFSQSRLTFTAEIIVALALGSWLNMLHHNVDRFVDGTFFRARHLAEKRLERAATAIGQAESHDAVDRFLIFEPVEALGLSCAALFRRDRSTGCFMRDVAVGWPATAGAMLAQDDPILLHLLAEEEPVRLADVRWSWADATALGDAALAIPVIMRDELIAVALYGPHRSGADIDPDETHSLVRFAQSAGAAYDHIDARSLRDRLEAVLRQSEAKDNELMQLRAQLVPQR